MKNYFEELREKGIQETEISIRQAYGLFDEGRITADQLERIVIKIFGIEKYCEYYEEWLEKNIPKNLLSSNLPDFTNSLFSEEIDHSSTGKIQRMERPKSNDSSCV